MFFEFLIFSSIKLLFLPAYRSTDFEVHRNWLAITSSLNLSQWYYEDTSEWTLDYPPVFAYFEYAMSFVARLFDENMLKIENLNYASFNTILFQRLSVIFADIVFFLGVQQCTKDVKDNNKRVYYYSILILGNVGLIFVDHIHFQYNGILFGILLISCGKMLQKEYLQAAFYYALLLNMKHIYIYIAPVYLFFLLKNYCFGSTQMFVINTLKLASIVLLVTAFSFGPFIHHIPQVMSRLFPFKRGLTHAYWAPNFWALYNLTDKILSVIFRLPNSNSTTGGLVQEQIYSILPNITPLMTFIITAIFMLPCCIKILLSEKESTRSFLKPMVICSATSFMFGWHVHEKAILMIMIPLQVLCSRTNSSSEMNSSFFLTIFGLYSLTPLLYPKELIIVKLSLYICYIILNYYVDRQSHFFRNFKSYEHIYNLGIIMLPFYEFFLQYLLGLDQKLQFMPLMLTSVYCSIGMCYFWIKYYLEYLYESVDEDKKSK